MPKVLFWGTQAYQELLWQRRPVKQTAVSVCGKWWAKNIVSNTRQVTLLHCCSPLVAQLSKQNSSEILLFGIVSQTCSATVQWGVKQKCMHQNTLQHSVVHSHSEQQPVHCSGYYSGQYPLQQWTSSTDSWVHQAIKAKQTGLCTDIFNANKPWRAHNGSPVTPPHLHLQVHHWFQLAYHQSRQVHDSITHTIPHNM